MGDDFSKGVGGVIRNIFSIVGATSVDFIHKNFVFRTFTVEEGVRD